MGKIVTPTYRVEYADNLLAMHKTRADAVSRIDRKPVLIVAWHGKQDGRANAANLEAWRQQCNKSFLTGGSNAHISKAFDIIPHIYWARLVRQCDDSVVAEINAPMFGAM